MGKLSNAKEDLGRAREIVGILLENKVLTGASPERVARVLTELGPTFVKFGQIMSSRPDMLGPEYCAEFKKLCSNVPPMSFQEVQAIIEESTGMELRQLFSEFDDRPLGAASIGQAHMAWLKNGQQVVVKVQRRGIREVMAKDVHLMHTVVKLLPSNYKNMIDMDGVIDEFWRVSQQEMDFLNEGSNLEQFYKYNEDVAFVTCPKPYRELSTDKVLIMECVNGINLTDHEELIRRGYDLNEIGTKIADNFVKQVMDDGFFHADPHQGNIMIRDGQIVWLDLGMVGTLNKNDRVQITKAILAISRHDIAGLVDFVLTIGIYKDRPDRTRLYENLSLFLSKYATLDLASIDLAEVFTEMTNVLRENHIELPSNLTMLIRGLATVEGVVADISPELQVMDVATSRIRAEFVTPERIRAQARKQVAGVGNSLMKLVEVPAILSDLLKSYSRNDTRIKLDLNSSDNMSNMLSRITSKLVFGMICAALFIGASILCAAGTGPMAAGIPVLAVVGFIAALFILIQLIIEHIKAAKRR